MMKTNLEQIDDEDEDPKQINEAKSRWGREKKNEKEKGRKKRSRRERKRKKEKIFFK